MMTGEFTLTFQKHGTTTPLSMSVSIDTATSGSCSEEISEGSILKYGTKYEVLSLTSATLHFTIADSLTFTTDPEPPRLKSMSSRSLTRKKDELTISFVGSLLPDGTGTIRVKASDSDVVEGVLTRVSATECTGVIPTAWKEDATHVSFGKTYSVKSAKIGSSEIVVDSGISVPVPNPAVITSFSVPTECSSELFEIEVIGQNLPSSNTYTLTLSDSHTISVTFSDSTKGKWIVSASLPSQIQFSTTYSVSSVTLGDDHVLLNATTFTTPGGPTLTSISTSLTLPLKKEVILSLSGLRMKSGEFDLTFRKQGTSKPLSMSVTITSETKGSGSEDIFGGTILEFGTTYEVLSLTSDTLHFALASSLIFTTDPEPTRLTSISYNKLSDKDRKADFTVGGRVMTNGENYTIIVNKTGTAVQKTFEVTMSSAEVGGGSAVLFSQTEEEIELDYDTEYEVVGVKDSSQLSILIEGGLTFTTDPEPCRLMKIVSAKDEGLNSTTLTLSSRVLKEGQEYEVKVTGTPLSSKSNAIHETTFSFTATSASLNTVPFTLYPFDDAVVEYGHSDSVDWMKVVD
ncbi:hypothetical protein BLNAU_9604 [Blattamonas nauphoetae]|uniref:Uncharacterized protein n=1 Tax=Blattamonas nauphoetae TaxID=2049346 RepID=A0ABQ9XV64_9EUKA|nr:hypothetical protein BLNAU_9604 [Blattamonas nauphoetae]